MKYIWFIVALTVILSPLEGKIEVKQYPQVAISELHLDNGMVVVLKQTDFEPGEITVKLTASGGYDSLPTEQISSGRFAHKISWESGLGRLDADQLSTLLYNRSIEFSTKVTPYSRTIEGVTEKKGLNTLIKLINLQFTEQKFTEEGFKALKENVKYKIDNRDDYHYNTFDDLHKELNCCGQYPHVEKNRRNLAQVDFETAKKFAYDSFKDPSEFICVIVGDFDTKKVMKFISRHLNTIPKAKKPLLFGEPSLATFPEGNKYSKVKLYHRNDSITRFTFDVGIDLKEDNIHALHAACKVIENRIASALTSRMYKGGVQLNVSLELPYYPCSHSCWLNLQIVCPCSFTEKGAEITLQELRRIVGMGITCDEFNQMKSYYKKCDCYWLTENNYWLESLTNYYLSKWNPKSLLSINQVDSLTQSDLSTLLKEMINLNNYTRITAIP